MFPDKDSYTSVSSPAQRTTEAAGESSVLIVFLKMMESMVPTRMYLKSNIKFVLNNFCCMYYSLILSTTKAKKDASQNIGNIYRMNDSSSKFWIIGQGFSSVSISA